MTTNDDDPYSRELRVPGKWVLAALDSRVFLPTKVTPISFRSHRLYVIPGTDKLLPAVAVKLTGAETTQDGQRLLFHFLSSLSWVEGRGVQVIHWSGGSLPHRIGRSVPMQLVNENLELDYFPDPSDTRTRWALAFYREGLSLSHVAYLPMNIIPTGAGDAAFMAEISSLEAEAERRRSANADTTCRTEDGAP